MPFDMGFNFRSTAGFVADQAFAVPVLGEAFPHTYTNANGLSINAGWDGALNADNIDNTNDARLAGRNIVNGLSTRTFTVDLSSGSAPGAGIYTIDLAVGDASGGQTEEFQLKDTSTILIQIASPGQATLIHHYIDATLADVLATTIWTGTRTNKAFSTTTVNLTLNQAADNINTALAHFRLTLVPPPAPPPTGSPASGRREESMYRLVLGQHGPGRGNPWGLGDLSVGRKR